MPVSARTFQVLYIIRKRAMDELPTRMDDIADFIADLRKTPNLTYRQAYISPTHLRSLLHRMTVSDGLLVKDRTQAFEMTPKGSQMADLLDGWDACSSLFIDRYKEVLCTAALEQRQRLGQGPGTIQDIASAAGISVNSVRRGLTVLLDEGAILTATGDHNYSTYTCPEPEEVAPEEVAPEEPEDSIATVLASIDSNSSQRWVCNHPSSRIEPEDVLSLRKILGEEDHPPETLYLSEDKLTEEPPAKEPVEYCEAGPYEWNNVLPEDKETMIIHAKATGLSLGDFIKYLCQLHETRFKAVLGL